MKFFIPAIIFFLGSSFAAVPSGKVKKLLRVEYYKPMFGHIHRNPSRYSSSMSTISCGHPVKIYKLENKKGGQAQIEFNEDWNFVKVGPYEGYIRKEYLSRKKPQCFQDKYPKFFDEIGLELADLYYWGKLYDQYIQGKSRVK